MFIESVAAIDWDDGPVTALVQVRETGPWLAFLLSATRGPRNRIHGMVPASSAAATALNDALAKANRGDDEIGQRFHCAIAESLGPLVLLRGSCIPTGEVPNSVELSWTEFRGRVTFSPEVAFEAQRVDYWADIFDAAEAEG